jgi:flagellum-specific peptidoglycan hydrolase FlgJ
MFATLAVIDERASGCPAELSLAQAIIETGWGARMPGNNCFGIKCADRHKICQDISTNEYIGGKLTAVTQRFASYASVSDSFKDHGWLITHGAPYATAWAKYQKSHDLKALIQDIAPIYAKGPDAEHNPAYANLINDVLGMGEVKQAMNKARGLPLPALTQS